MAPSAKYLSFFFLIFLISSFTQIHARESKFFSKFNFHQHMSITASGNNAHTNVVPFGGKEEPRFTPQTGNGYGLYGHVSDQLSPSSAPAYPPDTYADTPAIAANPPDTYAGAPTPVYAPDTYANIPTPAYAPDIYAEAPTPAYAPQTHESIPDKASDEENTGASYSSKEFETEFSKDNFNNNNNEANTKKFGIDETRLMGNGDTKNSYNGNYGEKNNEEFRNNWFGRKQQGMSDTRFAENGRYFYPTKETYPRNEYQPTQRTGDNGNTGNDGGYKTQQFNLGDARLGENGENNNGGNIDDQVSKNQAQIEKQGMSDTRFMENGRYFYDLSKETNQHKEYQHINNIDNDGEYKAQQFDLVDARLGENGDNNDNENSDNQVSKNQDQIEKQGMSDTRFMENGRYSYDLNKETDQHKEYQPTDNNDNDGEYKAQQFDLVDARLQENGNNNYANSDNQVRENKPQREKQGMSDTRFMENGRYFYDVSNESYNINGEKPVGQSHGDFGTTRGVDLRSEENEGNYYVNNADEFSNSEKESRYQEESPEEYVP